MKKDFNQIGVSESVQFGKNGGFFLWDTDHFESTSDGTTLAQIRVPTTPIDANDAASKSYVDSIKTVVDTVDTTVIKAASTSTVNVNITSVVPINFDVSVISNGGSAISHNPSTNNSRFTINETGLYRVTFNARLQTFTIRNAPQFAIRRNGTTLIDDDRVSHTYMRDLSGHSNTTANFSVVAELISGEYVEVCTAGQDGSNGVVELTGQTTFTIEKMEVAEQGVAGPPGPPGAPGDITWEGPWSPGTYLINQAVENNGSSWVCTVSSTTEEPTATATDWDLLAARGKAGPSGFVYVGHFIMTTTGLQSITGLGFEPKSVIFTAYANIFAENVNKASESGNIDNYQGGMQGYARNDFGTTVQQFIHSGGSGASINQTSLYASDTACIGIRHANANGNNAAFVTANLFSWDTDGFTIDVTSLAKNTVVVFQAYG